MHLVLIDWLRGCLALLRLAVATNCLHNAPGRKVIITRQLGEVAQTVASAIATDMDLLVNEQEEHHGQEAGAR